MQESNENKALVKSLLPDASQLIQSRAKLALFTLVLGDVCHCRLLLPFSFATLQSAAKQEFAQELKNDAFYFTYENGKGETLRLNSQPALDALLYELGEPSRVQLEVISPHLRLGEQPGRSVMTFSSENVVQYGMHIKLVHVETTCALHSHSTLTRTSQRQEVTCFSGRDENDVWILIPCDKEEKDNVKDNSPLDGKKKKKEKGDPIQSGEVFQLCHFLTNKFLFSSKTTPSEVTSNHQEVSCVREQSDGTKWRVTVKPTTKGKDEGIREADNFWKMDDTITLCHYPTRTYLHSHNKSFGQHNQNEVTCCNDRNYSIDWTVESLTVYKQV